MTYISPYYTGEEISCFVCGRKITKSRKYLQVIKGYPYLAHESCAKREEKAIEHRRLARRKKHKLVAKILLLKKVS